LGGTGGVGQGGKERKTVNYGGEKKKQLANKSYDESCTLQKTSIKKWAFAIGKATKMKGGLREEKRQVKYHQHN